MARLSSSFARAGAAVGVIVGVVCVLSPPPATLGWHWFVLLTAAATAVWLTGLLLPAALPGWRVVAFAMYGALGALLDLVQPWGSGFVAGFMAVAAIALAVPLRPALLASVPVLALLGVAEAATSDHPLNALLNVLLGLGFFFAASAFAAAKRDASGRLEQLLGQVEATRVAREESAVLEERARLARELHDVLAHTLSGLTLQLEAARLLAQRTSTDPRVLEQLDLAQRSARNGVLEGKRAIAALRGEPLAGLTDLPQLVAAFSRDTGIPTSFTETGAVGTLGEDAGLALYRAAQESFSNVRKHAPASRAVSVRLDWGPSTVALTIRNTGAPGAGPGATGFGFGLSGMTERAAALDGSVSAGPTDDGFEVRVTLPVQSSLEPAP